jgi:hypothetical protein
VDRYYLNNFDNLFNSYETLFELMVVNNWYGCFCRFGIPLPNSATAPHQRGQPLVGWPGMS